MSDIALNDISSLDLNLLKALDALLDERSVTRAASRLALTQPAVSGMLNRLRDRFDDPLFIRAPHGIVPTNRALALAEPVKRILSEINVLLQPETFNPAELHMTFEIAANDNDMQSIGLPFVLALKRQAPHVKVVFSSFHHLDIQARLSRGGLDLILWDPDNAFPSLHSRTLYHERYVCVMRKGHPAAALDSLSLDQFCSFEHVLVSYEGAKFAGVTDEALAKIGRRRHVSLSITSFLLLPSILKKSDFIAVAPEHLVRGVSGLKVMDPPISIPGYTKIMAWHERNHADQAQQWLRQVMYETCRE